MTVAEITNLRRLLKSSSLEYSVVKNTLARIASQDTGMAVAADSLKGPVGIAIGYDDPVLVLKKVLEFKKTNEKLQIKGAVVEGKFCGPDDGKRYSSPAVKRNPALYACRCIPGSTEQIGRGAQCYGHLVCIRYGIA